MQRTVGGNHISMNRQEGASFQLCLTLLYEAIHTDEVTIFLYGYRNLDDIFRDILSKLTDHNITYANGRYRFENHSTIKISTLEPNNDEFRGYKKLIIGIDEYAHFNYIVKGDHTMILTN